MTRIMENVRQWFSQTHVLLGHLETNENLTNAQCSLCILIGSNKNNNE